MRKFFEGLRCLGVCLMGACVGAILSELGVKDPIVFWWVGACTAFLAIKAKE